jgi:hypothetical protein
MPENVGGRWYDERSGFNDAVPCAGFHISSFYLLYNSSMLLFFHKVPGKAEAYIAHRIGQS